MKVFEGLKSGDPTAARNAMVELVDEAFWDTIGGNKRKRNGA
jgi:hypothetical protein